MHSINDQELEQPPLPASVNTTLQEVAAAMENISTRVRLLMQAPLDISADGTTSENVSCTNVAPDQSLPNEPKRVIRDWSTATFGTCDCGEHALVLPNERGVMTCMACFDCLYLAALTEYANQLRTLLVRQNAARETSASVAEGVMHVKALGLLAGMWSGGSEIDCWLDNILASTRAGTAGNASVPEHGQEEIEPLPTYRGEMAKNYSTVDFQYALGISTQSKRRPAPVTAPGITYRWL